MGLLPSSSSQIPCNVVHHVLHRAGEGRYLGGEGKSTQPAGRHARRDSLQMRKDVSPGAEGGSERRCHCLESLLPVSRAALPGGAGLGQSRLAPGFLLVLMEQSPAVGSLAYRPIPVAHPCPLRPTWK